MDKWERLKKILNEEIANDELQYEETLAPCFSHYISYALWLLNVMKDLEHMEDKKIIEDGQTCRMFDITLDELKNQALKDRWQKLKEYIEEKMQKYKNDFDDTYVYGHIDEEEDILNKMQELEKEGK